MPALQRPTEPAALPQQKLQQTGGGVAQLYRYPGLTASKAKTLLRKVGHILLPLANQLVRVGSCYGWLHATPGSYAALLYTAACAAHRSSADAHLPAALQAQEKASSSIVEIDGELVS